MSDKNGSVISGLVNKLDAAVMRGDTEKADEITDILFCLQGGTAADAVMPASFPETVKILGGDEPGNHQKKPKPIKRIIGIAAAAALVAALSMTALATNFFGLRDMVIPHDKPVTPPDAAPALSDTADAVEALPAEGGQSEPEPSYDLIPLQGFPDSKEFKASVEWTVFCQNYDTDHAILNQVGNKPNEYTEKYPMYLVYSKEMTDKLEEITAKYGLALHTSNTIAETPEALFSLAGVGNFLQSGSGGANKAYSAIVYNDGTFHFDGEAVLENGKFINYQFENFKKGVFSDVYLNIGDADDYREWHYTTKTGVEVSLALSETKALLIADRENYFIVVNVLAGTGDSSGFGSDSITNEDLQAFADVFDLTQIN